MFKVELVEDPPRIKARLAPGERSVFWSEVLPVAFPNHYLPRSLLQKVRRMRGAAVTVEHKTIIGSAPDGLPCLVVKGKRYAYLFRLHRRDELQEILPKKVVPKTTPGKWDHLRIDDSLEESA